MGSLHVAGPAEHKLGLLVPDFPDRGQGHLDVADRFNQTVGLSLLDGRPYKLCLDRLARLHGLGAGRPSDPMRRQTMGQFSVLGLPKGIDSKRSPTGVISHSEKGCRSKYEPPNRLLDGVCSDFERNGPWAGLMTWLEEHVDVAGPSGWDVLGQLLDG